MQDKINILVGGPVTEWPEALKKGDISGDWIGVDKGAIRLLKLNITPKIAVGDFDSTDDLEMAEVRQKVNQIELFPPEKDLTDTQIGVLTAIKYFQNRKIDIYGGTGGRMDHLLANVFLPLDPQFESIINQIRFIDAKNTISFYLPGAYTIKKETDKKYLAFINLTPLKGLNLPDEKYQLTDFSAGFPVAWASNEFIGEINHFSFDEGIITVIQSKD